MTPEFLTPEWFTWINRRLANAAIQEALLEDGTVVRVVFELDDGPTSLPHAVTLTITQAGIALSVGDHLSADLVVTLAFSDAQRISGGELEGAQALREGRLKVRGDVNAIVPLGSWMVSVQNSLLS